jgi:hypothetical protein
MVRKVEILLTDDLDGRTIPKGKGETVSFALDGKSYEIDLRTRHAAALRAALRPYVESGRPIQKRHGRRTGRTTLEADARTVKEWARANGYEVNDRGRVPAHVREAFVAAN